MIQRSSFWEAITTASPGSIRRRVVAGFLFLGRGPGRSTSQLPYRGQHGAAQCDHHPGPRFPSSEWVTPFAHRPLAPRPAHLCALRASPLLSLQPRPRGLRGPGPTAVLRSADPSGPVTLVRVRRKLRRLLDVRLHLIIKCGYSGPPCLFYVMF